MVAGPNLLHGPDVKRGELPDVAIAAGHLVEAPVARRAARAFHELHFPPGHLHAALAEGNDQGFCFRAVAHGLPVVAALGAGADRNPFASVLVRDDIRPVGQQTLWRSSQVKTFWKTVSLASRNSPVLRSSFQRMPALPMVNASLLAPISTRTRS